ncbi:sigma E protease regulator RseP [Alkalimonas collagenimarina]|uniref:Zinc metalloprotease n=1 Tax=Alkalimonas collagenimarina TaxID=400390 RepID=A0ABT9GV73_9GAMM|nr:sigma E protease regulator RseP [Alkalimonas collagenimarina]MDP4534928.1 sigma E protease regulator RseP [Alkalimonas collagenimarina]
MSALVWNLFSFILALGILITVHEFGHFWVARRNGVLVKRFSIGFGKALFRWRDRQGTEFVIAMIPLGGYVRMLDDRFDPVLPQFKDLAFNQKNVRQRMAIIAAGPLANFLFAILVLWFMYMIGVPEARPVIADIRAGSIAAEARVGEQQQIVAVNGRTASDVRAVNLLLVEQLGRNEITLQLEHRQTGQQTEATLNTTTWQFDPDRQTIFDSLGIELMMPKILTSLAQVEASSPAENAGLLAGDTIVEINQQMINNWSELTEWIQNNPGEALDFSILRQGERLTLTVTPGQRQTADGFSQGYIGIVPEVSDWPEGIRYVQRHNPLAALQVGVHQTWQLTRLSFSMIGKFIFGDVSVRHLSGPISIAQGAGTTASIGLIAFLSFLALISVNLGVINLLPLPILDGGHLMYMVVELIRGKPVSEKAQEIGFRIGAMVLLLLMGIALLNDISRL